MADFNVLENPEEGEDFVNSQLPLDENNKILITEEYLLKHNSREIAYHFLELWEHKEIDERLILLLYFRLKKALDTLKETFKFNETIFDFWAKAKEGKELKFHGVSFVQGVHSSYNYNICGHPEYDRIMELKKEFEKEFKAMVPFNDPNHKVRITINPETSEILEYNGPELNQTLYIKGNNQL